MKANQVSARIVLSAATEALLCEWVKASIAVDGAVAKADKSSGKLIDAAWADGVRSTHLRVKMKGDRKAENPEFQKDLHKRIGTLILMQYPDAVAKLVEGDNAKKLVNGKNKRRWQQVLGGKMSDVVKGLERREAAEEAEEAEDAEDAEDSASSAQATLNSRLLKEIDAIVTRVEKTEGTAFDKFFVLKELRAVRAHIAARDAGIGADEGDDE